MCSSGEFKITALYGDPQPPEDEKKYIHIPPKALEEKLRIVIKSYAHFVNRLVKEKLVDGKIRFSLFFNILNCACPDLTPDSLKLIIDQYGISHEFGVDYQLFIEKFLDNRIAISHETLRYVAGSYAYENIINALKNPNYDLTQYLPKRCFFKNGRIFPDDIKNILTSLRLACRESEFKKLWIRKFDNQEFGSILTKRFLEMRYSRFQNTSKKKEAPLTISRFPKLDHTFALSAQNLQQKVPMLLLGSDLCNYINIKDKCPMILRSNGQNRSMTKDDFKIVLKRLCIEISDEEFASKWNKLTSALKIKSTNAIPLSKLIKMFNICELIPSTFPKGLEKAHSDEFIMRLLYQDDCSANIFVQHLNHFSKNQKELECVNELKSVNFAEFLRKSDYYKVMESRSFVDSQVNYFQEASSILKPVIERNRERLIKFFRNCDSLGKGWISRDKTQKLLIPFVSEFAGHSITKEVIDAVFFHFEKTPSQFFYADLVAYFCSPNDRAYLRMITDHKSELEKTSFEMIGIIRKKVLDKYWLLKKAYQRNCKSRNGMTNEDFAELISQIGMEFDKSALDHLCSLFNPQLRCVISQEAFIKTALQFY